MKNNRIVLFILLIIICLSAYLDSPYSFLNKNLYYTATEPTTVPALNTVEPADNNDTEEKLFKSKKSGGYIVETYREYEIFKDAQGNVTKEEPTSHYDVLKYWDYKQKKK